MGKLRYNHAFDFACEVVSDYEVAWEDPDMVGKLRGALLERLLRLDDIELRDACNCFDSMEEDEPDESPAPPDVDGTPGGVYGYWGQLGNAVSAMASTWPAEVRHWFVEEADMGVFLQKILGEEPEP